MNDHILYRNLPSIISEKFGSDNYHIMCYNFDHRCFNFLDKDKNGYIDKKEFVKGFSRIYSSNIEVSMKLIYELFDFGKDNYMSREDIQSSNPNETLEDELSLKNIQRVFDELPHKNDFDAYKDLAEDKHFKLFKKQVTPETVLCILNTIRSSLPCTNNFYLYLRNYQRVLQKGVKSSSTNEDSKKAVEINMTPKVSWSPLVSPKLGQKFFGTSQLATQKMQHKRLNSTQMGNGKQNPLLKYALGPDAVKNDDKTDEEEVKRESRMPDIQVENMGKETRKFDKSSFKIDMAAPISKFLGRYGF